MYKTQKKKCFVCGDNAIGKNFGALCCESCRSFFRRNAFKIDSLKCEKNGKCVINVENRKKCQKCRFNKCLAIGMKTEFILMKTRKESSNSEFVNSDDSENVQVHRRRASIDLNSNSSNNSTLFDPEFDALFENCCLSEQQINEEIMKIEESFNNSINSSELERVHKIREHSLIPIVRPIATFNKELNCIELNRLEELSTANNCLHFLFTPLTPKIFEFSTIREYYSITRSHKLFDEMAKQYVKYCKKLSSFKEMCDQDQLSLIKMGYYEAISWKTVASFNFDDQSFAFYFDNGYTARVSLQLYKKENQNIYNLLHNFFKKVRSEWISDSVITNLLSALTLFSPNKSKLVHKELIKLKQQMYLYLLQRYLIQKYGSESESMEMYSKIMKSFDEMKTLVVFENEFGKEFIETASPLIKEIFDI